MNLINGIGMMLLIVDPQNDFINGSLPVPGAEKAMNDLGVYLREHGDAYDVIVVTCDNHPLQHSSFREYGGRWPRHCVVSSNGAAIWRPIMDALISHASKVVILHKGENIQKDEYSIFQTERGASEIEALINTHHIRTIDICGLAGDICVADTMADIATTYPHLNLHLLDEFTAFISKIPCRCPHL